MLSQISDKFPDFVKKNILLVFLATFILGGVVVYITLEKKLQSSCIMQVSADTDNADENKDNEKLGSIFIDISGAVINPGVYEVENGTRVGDILALAGGASGEASATWVSRNLNLSKKVEDSSKIYIPFEWEFYLPEEYKISKTVNKNYASNTDFDNSENKKTLENNDSNNQNDESDQTDISDGGNGDTSDAGGVESDGKINVNTASSSELDTLPGIGPANAEKIISNRPYANISEFESKSGLYKSTVENIKDLITF